MSEMRRHGEARLWHAVMLAAFMAAAGLTWTGGASAADLRGTTVSGDWDFEAGLRYWYSDGKSKKALYGAGVGLVSQLNYSGLKAHAGELHMRADHRPTGVFLRALGGLGLADQGQLSDRDYLPAPIGFSRTYSAQEDGSLAYGGADLGYTFYDDRIDGTFGVRLGGYVGYFFYREHLNGFGCAQTAGNPYICGVGVPMGTKAISQYNDWHSLRLGALMDFSFGDRMTLTLDGAYLHTWLDGRDHHWLRPEINPLPEKGDGHGMQAEAILNYRLTDAFSIGIGGRYWQFGRIDAKAHFDDTAAHGSEQKERWKTTRYGVFLQGIYRF